MVIVDKVFIVESKLLNFKDKSRSPIEESVVSGGFLYLAMED